MQHHLHRSAELHVRMGCKSCQNAQTGKVESWYRTCPVFRLIVPLKILVGVLLSKTRMNGHNLLGKIGSESSSMQHIDRNDSLACRMETGRQANSGVLYGGICIGRQSIPRLQCRSCLEYALSTCASKIVKDARTAARKIH
jgi:hypothetical protein